MNAIRASAAEKVLEHFLEAAAAPDLWPEALHELSVACGAAGAAAHASDGLTTLVTVASKGVEELHDGFVKRWSAPELNSHRARGIELIRKGWRGALTEEHCFSRDDLAKDPFQQEFFLRSGYSSFAGMILGRNSGASLSVSVIRRIDQGTYSRGELAFINKLSRYLRAASAVALRLSDESTRRLTDAFAAAGNPVALLNRDGRVAYMTAGFELLLGDGLRTQAGRLQCWQSEANNALAAAIDVAVHHDGTLCKPFDAVVIPRRQGLRPLVAHVLPVVGRARDILRLVSAIVTLTDLDAAASPLANRVLEKAFRLTSAEARLASQIATGKSLPEISQTEGVVYETLRARLKSVFEKTGTGRQAELVALLSKLSNSVS
jgi:DNA-binding CsgD family transcriptional regulator